MEKKSINNISSYKNHSGQSFMEFLFLFLILIIMSFTLMRGVNTAIADRWVQFITIITSPDPDNPTKVELL